MIQGALVEVRSLGPGMAGWGCGFASVWGVGLGLSLLRVERDPMMVMMVMMMNCLSLGPAPLPLSDKNDVAQFSFMFPRPVV